MPDQIPSRERNSSLREGVGATSTLPDRENEGSEEPGTAAHDGIADRARELFAAGTIEARSIGERHVSVAVPFRAAERNRSVAAGVLAGGIAYRIFLWLLPFGLIVGGVLGLLDADRTQRALSTGGLPEAVVNAIVAAAQAADTNSWWLLATGVPLLLWEGYTGAKALQLVHSLVWNDPPHRTNAVSSSLVFTGAMCAFTAAVSLTWWFRHATELRQLLVVAVTIGALAGGWLLVSLHLPHGTATWKALLPGAFLVAIGFEVTHGLVVYLLGPKLEKATTLYGGLGVVATLLFFMYVVGRIVVTAPILNSSLHEELKGRKHREEVRIQQNTCK